MDIDVGFLRAITGNNSSSFLSSEESRNRQGNEMHQRLSTMYSPMLKTYKSKADDGSNSKVCWPISVGDASKDTTLFNQEFSPNIVIFGSTAHPSGKKKKRFASDRSNEEGVLQIIFSGLSSWKSFVFVSDQMIWEEGNSLWPRFLHDFKWRK